jgi:hypothetical protein
MEEDSDRPHLACEGTPEDYFARGVLRDLPAPVHGVPFGGLILQWFEENGCGKSADLGDAQAPYIY